MKTSLFRIAPLALAALIATAPKAAAHELFEIVLEDGWSVEAPVDLRHIDFPDHFAGTFRITNKLTTSPIFPDPEFRSRYVIRGTAPQQLRPDESAPVSLQLNLTGRSGNLSTPMELVVLRTGAGLPERTSRERRDPTTTHQVPIKRHLLIDRSGRSTIVDQERGSRNILVADCETGVFSGILTPLHQDPAILARSIRFPETISDDSGNKLTVTASRQDRDDVPGTYLVQLTPITPGQVTANTQLFFPIEYIGEGRRASVVRHIPLTLLGEYREQGTDDAPFWTTLEVTVASGRVIPRILVLEDPPRPDNRISIHPIYVMNGRARINDSSRDISGQPTDFIPLQFRKQEGDRLIYDAPRLIGPRAIILIDHPIDGTGLPVFFEHDGEGHVAQVDTTYHVRRTYSVNSDVMSATDGQQLELRVQIPSFGVHDYVRWSNGQIIHNQFQYLVTWPNGQTTAMIPQIPSTLPILVRATLSSKEGTIEGVYRTPTFSHEFMVE